MAIEVDTDALFLYNEDSSSKEKKEDKMPGLPKTKEALRAEIEQLRLRVSILEQTQQPNLENSIKLKEPEPFNPLEGKVEFGQKTGVFCRIGFSEQDKI